MGLVGGEGDRTFARVDEVDESEREVNDAVAVRVFDACMVFQLVPAFRAVLG